MHAAAWHTGLLQPHGHASRVPGTLAAAVARDDDGLALRYEYIGPVDALALPQPAERPARRHELWQATCFEAFLAAPGDDRYWEINLSPAGDWNLYRFERYRDGRSDPLLAAAPTVHASRPEADRYVLEARVPMPEGFPRRTPLDVGLTAVFAWHEGPKTYWALTHRAPKPDFHLRDSFSLRLT